MGFAMLVTGNLALVLSNRSWSRGVLSAIRQPNPVLAALLAVALGLLAMTLTVPLLSRLFRFETPGAGSLGLIAIGGVFCLLWCELLKAVRAKLGARGS